jgi:ribonuclease Z
MRLAAAGSSAGALRAVCLTHLHSDHLTDLNDVVTTRWITSFQPSPLVLFGPVGTTDVVSGINAMLAHDTTYRLAHHADLTWPPPIEMTEVTGDELLHDGDVRVTAVHTDHRPVQPTLGYRIDDGGRSVVIAGDTVPCEPLDELCRDANVLVHTAIRRDLIEGIGLARLTDVLDYHSSVEDAASTAHRAGVGTLLLTHLVPAPAPEAEGEWLHRAQSRFGGHVRVARDLLVIDV